MSAQESVVLVDPDARISEWSLRVPRPLRRVAGAVGIQDPAVRWRAVHETDGCCRLRWKSLSGIENTGEATFESVLGSTPATRVILSMSYTLPGLSRVPGLKAIVEAPLAQRFVRRTMLSTMERFKHSMEAQVNAPVVVANGQAELHGDAIE